MSRATLFNFRGSLEFYRPFTSTAYFDIYVTCKREDITLSYGNSRITVSNSMGGGRKLQCGVWHFLIGPHDN